MINLGMSKMLLLAPLMDKKLDDLDVETVQRVLVAFGSPVKVNEELLSAGLALLAGENIHSVSDMIKSPESIQTLVGMLARGAGLVSPQVTDIKPTGEMVTNVVNVEPALYTAAPGWRLN